MKNLAQDIYQEVSEPSRKKMKDAVDRVSARASTSRGSESSIQKAAAQATDRKVKIDSLKKLLKIEVINDASLRLLKSNAYQAFMTEKIMFRLVSSTSENVAATFNRVFLSVQFSKRFIAFLYWGDDNR